MLANDGAYVMGRNMFGPGRGEWDLDWKGWWGDDPPYHAPVFVLTHHEREPLEMEGGTTFHFVTEGIERAVQLAREAAGELDIEVAGGASTIQQALRAGLLDELYLHVVPVLLGTGERLFDGVTGIDLAPVEVIASPAVTHIRYAIDTSER
jgi:dihydrofolate reductase